MPFINSKSFRRITSGEGGYIINPKNKYELMESGERTNWGELVRKEDPIPCQIPTGIDLIMLSTYMIYVGDIVGEFISYDNKIPKGDPRHRCGKFVKYYFVTDCFVDSSGRNTFNAEEILEDDTNGRRVSERTPAKVQFREEALSNGCFRYVRDKCIWTFGKVKIPATRDNTWKSDICVIDDIYDLNCLKVQGLFKPAMMVSDLLVAAIVNYEPLMKIFVENISEYPRYIAANILSKITRCDISRFRSYDPAKILNDIWRHGVTSRYVCLMDEISAQAILRTPWLNSDIEKIKAPIILNRHFYITQKMIKTEMAVVQELWNMMRLKSILSEIDNKLTSLNTFTTEQAKLLRKLGNIRDKAATQYDETLMMRNIVSENGESNSTVDTLLRENERKREGYEYRARSIMDHVSNMEMRIDQIKDDIESLRLDYSKATNDTNLPQYDKHYLMKLPNTIVCSTATKHSTDIAYTTSLMVKVFDQYMLLGVEFSDYFVKQHSVFFHRSYVATRIEKPADVKSLDLKVMRKQSPCTLQHNFCYEMLLVATSMGIEYLRKLHKLNMKNTALGYPFIRTSHVAIMAGSQPDAEERNITAAVEFFASTREYFCPRKPGSVFDKYFIEQNKKKHSTDNSYVMGCGCQSAQFSALCCTYGYYNYYDYYPSRANIVEKHQTEAKRKMLEAVFNRGERGFLTDSGLDKHSVYALTSNFPEIIKQNWDLVDGAIMNIIYKNKAYQFLALIDKLCPSNVNLKLTPADLTLMSDIPDYVEALLRKRNEYDCIPPEMVPRMLLTKSPAISDEQKSRHQILGPALEIAMQDFHSISTLYESSINRFVENFRSYLVERHERMKHYVRSETNPKHMRLKELIYSNINTEVPHQERYLFEKMRQISNKVLNICFNIGFNAATGRIVEDDAPDFPIDITYQDAYCPLGENGPATSSISYLHLIQRFIEVVDPFEEVITALQRACSMRRNWKLLGYPRLTNHQKLFDLIESKLHTRRTINETNQNYMYRQPVERGPLVERLIQAGLITL